MATTDAVLKYFAEIIEKELGIVYSAQNFFQLEKRLDVIAKNLGLASPVEVQQKAIKDGITGVFRQMLLDTATNNETQFYRDPKIYNAIEKFVVPEVKKANPAMMMMRFWSCASSFGQEPYSLAMLLTEMAAKDKTLPRFDITATDISDHALERAKSGMYSQLEIQRGLPAQLMVKYFKKNEKDEWQLTPQIRNLVRFQKMNLLSIQGISGPMDVVLCRNVLIYQRDDKKREILSNISKLISKKGFLILGAAESLIGLSNDYDNIFAEGVVVYRKKN